MDGLRVNRLEVAAAGEGSVPGGSRLRVVLFYAVATVVAFPILETVLRGADARHYGFDVFDDGTVTRLGGWRALFTTHGQALWNPFLTAGNAVLAQFTATPLAVDSLVALVLPPFLTYVLFLTLIIFISGLSMHLFLEESVGLPREASALGALIFLFSFKHYNIGFPPALIPLLLWISDRIERTGSARVRWMALGTVTAAFSLYNFNSQAAVIGAGLHLAYAGFVPSTVRERRSRLLHWLGIWGIALALYGPVLMTQVVLLPESVRSIRNTRQWFPDIGTSLREFGRTYAEVIGGRPTLAAAGMPLGEAVYGTLYAGALGSLILLLSIGHARRNRREKAITWLLLLIPLIDLLALTIGPAAERHLGLLKSFQFVRIRLFLPFALAANVAIAVSLLQQRAWTLRSRRPATVIALGCVALFLVQAALSSRMTLYIIRRRGFPPSGIATQERLLGFALAAAYFVASASFVVLMVAWSRRGRAGWPATGRVAWLLTPLILVVFADRVAFARIERYVDSGHLISFRKALGRTPAIRFLLSLPNPEGYRVLTVGDHSQRNLQDHPNRLFFCGLACADGYENIYPLRYHQLFGLLTAPSLERDPRRAANFGSWGQRAYAWGTDLNNAIAGLAGIRWMYVRGMPAPPMPWKEVFAQGDEKVFEDTEVFPRAFIVGQLRRFPDRGQLLSALGTASDTELRTAAFVENGDVREVAVDAVSSSATTATIRRLASDQVEVDVETPGRGVLVLSDVWVPGWTASVDGVPKTVIPVDAAFRGVEVATGQSRVVFTYRPTYTYAGFALAVVGLSVVVFLFVGGRRRR